MLAQSVIRPFLRWSLRFAYVAILFAGTGCSGPYIRSQQTAYQTDPKGQLSHLASDCGKGGDCGHGCSDGQLKLGLPRSILHAISGPFVPHVIVDPYQSTAHPPHSKFHPVPTRPVFAPLRDDFGIQPFGTELWPSGDRPSQRDLPQIPGFPQPRPPAQKLGVLPLPKYRSTHRVTRAPRRAEPSERVADNARFVQL